MKTRALKNYDSSVGVEAYDIDWNNQDELVELGKLAADQCIVFVDERVPNDVLAKTMSSWGDPAGALVHDWVAEKKLVGRHWRDVYFSLGCTTAEVKSELKSYVSTVTYRKDDRGRALGIFSNGELDWHSDQCARDDSQRIIGLQSISDSANSQTQFLCTFDAYESLSESMKSMIKELWVKHKWRPGVMAPGLNQAQSIVARYNMIAIDGQETQLFHETATGRPGIKMPTHSFNGFVGMSDAESQRVLDELIKAVYKEKYVYTRDWADGQLMLMDQEITLHKRPTTIKDGDKRSMARTICYVNKILPQQARRQTVRVNGKDLSFDELAKLVDEDRQHQFEVEQNNEYEISVD